LKVLTLSEGIYGYYEIGELETTSTELHRYIVIRPGNSIPMDAIFVDILSMIVELPEGKGQGTVVFPLYRLKD
jgi:hypothetical protein